ncbi:secretory phospholipase A2 receptor-like isoform X1 [Cololabis saira]|uniref:secretory phospholipase A2 receptor-like isoform X1 n=1 Tax=Cololabis saira TaxID=129043 RepID=UPI002AD47DD3|nr:secretory phospholipase A2 receptor-like isoform X1 [Cololabis saira]
MGRILNVIVLTGLCHLPFCALQYVLYPENKTWQEAQSFCREHCVDLGSFKFLGDMKHILASLKDHYLDAAWFGLMKGDTMNWHWSIGDRYFYREGEKDYVSPGEQDLNYYCRVSDGSTVHGHPCDAAHYSICYNATKIGDDRYVLHTEELSWNDALDYCRRHSSDLTSVRNTAEHNAIQNKAAGNIVWIGSFKDPWTWSDQNSYSVRDWVDGKAVFSEDDESCVAVIKSESGRWAHRDCAEKHRFICNCTETGSEETTEETAEEFTGNQRFIIVRINGQDSTMNLSDSAVQDSILEQMKVHGAGGWKLRWKKQPDGNVFVKETL